MDLTVGIITWKSKELLRGLLDSLAEGLAEIESETVVLDNGSDDGTIEMVEKEYPGVIFVKNAVNRGVAPARNQILEYTRGRYLVFLDVDTVVKPASLKTLVARLDQYPEVGIGGPKLVYGDGRLQLSCRPFPVIMNIVIEGTFLRKYFPNNRFVKQYNMQEWEHNQIRCVDWIYGACLMIRTELFRSLGGFDEGYFYLYEDVDLCLRAKKRGFPTLYIPDAVVVHYLEREEKSIFHPRIITHIRSISRYLLKKWGVIGNES